MMLVERFGQDLVLGETARSASTLGSFSSPRVAGGVSKGQQLGILGGESCASRRAARGRVRRLSALVSFSNCFAGQAAYAAAGWRALPASRLAGALQVMTGSFMGTTLVRADWRRWLRGARLQLAASQRASAILAASGWRGRSGLRFRAAS